MASFDAWDFLALAGLLAAAAGLWLLAPPAVLVLGGLLLVTVDIIRALRSPREEGGR